VSDESTGKSAPEYAEPIKDKQNANGNEKNSCSYIQVSYDLSHLTEGLDDIVNENGNEQERDR
jgi:hypothetical protein